MTNKVLVIAPRADDLPYQENEVDGLLTTLPNSVAVQGEVTETRLAPYFEDKYEGLWFIGHGTQYGITLSDGTLGIDALISYINRVEPEWVVVNACHSDELVNKLLLATCADLLVVSNAVQDKDAWRIARLVAYELSEGKDIREAVERILPSRLGRFRFYPNNKRVTMHENTTRIEERLDRLIHDMSAIGERVVAIEVQLKSVEQKVDAQRSGMTLWYVAALAGAASLVILLSHMFYT
jgi:hypothetical protein